LATDRLPTAVDLFDRALRGVPRPEDYHNPLVSLQEVRGFLEAGCRAYLEAGDHERAHRLAQFPVRLAAAPPGQGRRGQGAEAWAKAERDAAREADGDAARQLLASARGHFLEAAAAYEAAADAFPDRPELAEWLWHSGEGYSRGQDHPRTIAVL